VVSTPPSMTGPHHHHHLVVSTPPSMAGLHPHHHHHHHHPPIFAMPSFTTQITEEVEHNTNDQDKTLLENNDDIMNILSETETAAEDHSHHGQSPPEAEITRMGEDAGDFARSSKAAKMSSSDNPSGTNKKLQMIASIDDTVVEVPGGHPGHHGSDSGPYPESAS
ncbi:hypothetical protein OTU49_013428, partial [Cherax quadricarinatus]